ncbi:MAG: hypothetical protein QGH90_04600, partial [Candidatus Poseidoniaceae archaeon]|nr:hypothetical protein [Candidatus Poseidoniaceae archaeon]
MQLSPIALLMPEDVFAHLIDNLPLDQAHMLRAVARTENGTINHVALYKAIERSIDSEEFLNAKIWQWRKHRGKDVPDEPPHDPRRDMPILSKLRKKDLVPFAKNYGVEPTLVKDELLGKLKPTFSENPIFHQMIFSLIYAGHLTAEYIEEEEKPTMNIHLGNSSEIIQKRLKARWEADYADLRDLLNRFLIETFDLQNTALEQALLDTDRRQSVEAERELLAACDTPIPVPGGVTTSAYGVIMWILTAIDLKPHDRVLVCGAKGALTAALAKHIVGSGGEVRVLEWNSETADWARKSIQRHGFSEEDIRVIEEEDVTVGSGDEGYWTAIVMNGSIPKIPYPLLDQLDDEEGRLLFFMQNTSDQAQTCWVVHKNESIVTQQELSRFRFTPIRGKYGWDSIQDLQLDYERLKKTQRDKSKRERINRMDEILPYSLSRAFTVASNAKSPNDQHRLVIRLFELLNKYLVFLTLSLVGEQDNISDSMKDLLNKFSKKAQMGDWVQFLRHACKHKQKDGKLIEIQDFLQQKIQSESVLSTFLQLQKETGKERAGKRKSITTIEFLGQVVSYRNISQDGHGRRRSSSVIESNSQQLRDAFIELMGKPNPVTNWSLFHVDNNERRIEGGVKFAKRILMGNSFDYN